MVQLPPKQRYRIVTQTGLKSPPFPAPEGISLVTSHIYTRANLFYENVKHERHFMSPIIVRDAFQKALEYYYPFTGRLIPKPNGRYDIGRFDQGAIFEVVDSTDDFQAWKESNYSYSVVPFEELFPIQSYVGRDSPLFGVRFTYTRCGSCVASFNIHHKVADGTAFVQFMQLFARIAQGDTIDPNKVFLYTDRMRKPVQPLPNVNHAELYPSYKPGTAPPLNLKMAPSKKVIFAFDRTKLTTFKKNLMDTNSVKLSQYEVLVALLHKAIIRARQRESDYCSDLVCVVGQHHKHPDKRMLNYLGNYIVPVPISYKTSDVESKTVHEIAKDIREASRKVSIPYMESLEYYINHSDHVDWIQSPAARLGRGAIGVSDWSRFLAIADLGWGGYTTLRSFVETSPIPLITIMPSKLSDPNTMEVVIQLDIESLDRLVKDPEVLAYVKSIH